MRTGKPLVITDFENDPRLAPWRERAKPFGWRSCATFPVPRGARPYAILSVNSTEEGILDEDIIDLLGQIARNLSRTLDQLDQAAENRRFVAALAESESFSRGLIESTHEGVCVWDSEDRITFVNRMAVEIVGYAPDEASAILGKPVNEFLYDDDTKYSTLEQLSNANGRHIERRLRHKDGHAVWVSLSMTLRSDINGAYTGGFAMFSDITEHKAAEDKIRYLAHFDDLTKLPNRVLLGEYAEKILADAREKRVQCALLFLDLDNFKHINDALGHPVGDRFLAELAGRLQTVLKAQDVLARWGGDEFVLLLSDGNRADAASTAERVLELAAAPLTVGRFSLATTASIGIAIFPVDGKDLDGLYRAADIALNDAKRSGRRCWRFYTPAMQRRTRREAELAGALRKALDNQEFFLLYQPQVSLKTRRIRGVEALLRWRHPWFGMVSPVEMIPIAEETGLILPIGEWVLRTAARQAAQWLKKGVPFITMAVNVSATQVRHGDLPELVETVLQEVGLPGQFLELELTENVAMGEPERAAAMMEALGSLGVGIAIDDFGTGYSSLAYLKRFRCQVLKIDRTFVRGIGADPQDEALIEAILSLARSFKLSTLAEGVETLQQLGFLARQGCDGVQGYLFSRPLPPERIWSWLAKEAVFTGPGAIPGVP